MSPAGTAIGRLFLNSQVALRLSLVSLLAIGLSPAAFAQSVNIQSEESVDFTKFKTFTMGEGRITSKSPALNNDLTKKRIRSDIEKALTAKGLTITSGTADLKVSYEFGSSRQLEPKTYPAGARGLGTRVVNVPQSEGVLVIDLHDSSTNTLVWRGTSSESEPNPVKLADKIDGMVKKSMGKYPPKPAKH